MYPTTSSKRSVRVSVLILHITLSTLREKKEIKSCGETTIQEKKTPRKVNKGEQWNVKCLKYTKKNNSPNEKTRKNKQPQRKI